MPASLHNSGVRFASHGNVSTATKYTDLHYEPLYQEKLLLAVDVRCPALRLFIPDPEQIRDENRRLSYPVFNIHRIVNEPFLALQPQQSLTYVVENFLRRQASPSAMYSAPPA